MKRLKAQSFNIDLHIYPYTIYVIIGNPKLFRDCMDKIWKKPEEDIIIGWIETLEKRQKEGCFATTYHLESNDIIIFFAQPSIPKESPANFHNYIAHEIFHATSYVMQTINMPLGEDSEEAFAYLIGYITEQFYNQLKK